MTSAFHAHHGTDHSRIEEALVRLAMLGGVSQDRERDIDVGLSRAMRVLALSIMIGLLAAVVFVH